MLLSFSLENFGPFRDRTTLNLQATSHSEHPGNLIQSKTIKGGIVSSAIIIGPNASGKSYIFKAMRALIRMVYDTYPEKTRYPWYEPFAIDDIHPKSPTSFNIRLIIDDVLYDYSISYNSDSVVEESLRYYPEGRARLVFRRGADKENIKTNQKKLVGFLTNSSSFLVVRAKYNDPICTKVRDAILTIIPLESLDILNLAFRSCDYVSNDAGKRRMLLDGLQKADLGITDFATVDSEVKIKGVSELPPMPSGFDSVEDMRLNVKQIQLRHSFGDAENKKDVSFDINKESTGTKSVFGLMGPLVDGLLNGYTILIDEFGSHLHPLLTRWLVSQFSAENNPKGAQLIAVTHDVGLIDIKELLRRDQVYFTDKNPNNGSSTLYCLSDFKGTRITDQFLRDYLIGRFDAIPSVSSRGVMNGWR